ncbi:MAG: tRNA lysidine(34) synthetase TilS [Oscillospiraceae bacterium]
MFPPKGITAKMNIDFCEKYNMLPHGGIVLCAVSGGKDSMCLLKELCEIAPSYGFSVSCAHFNHCLRGADSDGDMEFVKSYCAERDIPCYVGSAEVAAFSRENGMGTEEAARILRYAFLEKTADEIGALRIATAHTADDNAETVLFNMARGSGLKGLCGIPPVRGKFIRPLLQTTTAEVLQYLDEHGIPHREDATNSEDNYTRNKIRHRIVPELQKINGGFNENLVRCVSLLREDDDYLSALAKSFADENFKNGALPAEKLFRLPRPVSARVLQSIAKCELSAAHIDAIRKIAGGENPHASVDLPGTRVTREYDKLLFGKAQAKEILPTLLKIGGETDILEAKLQINCKFIPKCAEIHNSFNNFFFKSDSICGNIFVKSRSDGEKIRLCGRACTKSLKKLFSENRLNGTERGTIPVLYDELGPIAIYGFGIAERCLPQAGDDVIRITLRTTAEAI